MGMRIGIVGAGAIGCVVGELLTRAGHDVTLIDQWPEHVETLKRRGLPLSGTCGDHVIPVIADSRGDAEAATGAIVRAGYRGFDPGALVIGTVDEVVERFRALGALGYTDVIVRHVTDEQAYVLASLARLAEVRTALA
jgi:alkanesulfonate monooxygenase SsuD/methylene tetrahydromethanopterin reductase-like flavin-dependent oxidoreductase (luciferase family)